MCGRFAAVERSPGSQENGAASHVQDESALVSADTCVR
jgi:hypothetical protein